VFAVQAAVLASLWLPDSACYASANRLLEALGQRRVALIAAEGALQGVLHHLVHAFRETPLAPSLADLVFDDVTRLLGSMQAEGLLRIVSTRAIQLVAFRLAMTFELDMEEAVAVTLAHINQVPLLFCDGDTAVQAMALERDIPGLQCVDIGGWEVD